MAIIVVNRRDLIVGRAIIPHEQRVFKALGSCLGVPVQQATGDQAERRGSFRMGLLFCSVPFCGEWNQGDAEQRAD